MATGNLHATPFCYTSLADRMANAMSNNSDEIRVQPSSPPSAGAVPSNQLANQTAEKHYHEYYIDVHRMV